MEVRGLLSTYDFPGDETPIIIGSARTALEGKDYHEQGTTAVKKLIKTLDSYIPDPETDGGRAQDLKSQIGFEAEIYILTEKEGGAPDDLSTTSKRQIWFDEKHAANASSLLPEGVSAVSPGDNLQVTVRLDGAMELGVHTSFKIKDGGRVVGIGIVAQSG